MTKPRLAAAGRMALIGAMPEASAAPLQLYSVVIPAHNEEDCVALTVEHLHVELRGRGIPHEIVVVDDGSTDGTWTVLQSLALRLPELRPVQNNGEHGFDGGDQQQIDDAYKTMREFIIKHLAE